MSYLASALYRHAEHHNNRCQGLPRHVHAMDLDPGFELWVADEDLIGDRSAQQIRLWDNTTRTLAFLTDRTGNREPATFSWTDHIGYVGQYQSYVGWMLTGGLGVVTHHNPQRGTITLRDELGYRVISELLTEPGPWRIYDRQIQDIWHQVLSDKFPGWEL